MAAMILALALAATAPADGVAGAGLPGDWRLSAMTHHPEPPQRRHAPTVSFTADGRVSGRDGCNGFGGTYRIDGDRLAAGGMSVTAMACLRPDDQISMRGVMRLCARSPTPGSRSAATC